MALTKSASGEVLPRTFGEGAAVVPFGWDVVVVAVFSIAIYTLAMSVRLTPEEVRRHVEDGREQGTLASVAHVCHLAWTKAER